MHGSGGMPVQVHGMDDQPAATWYEIMISHAHIYAPIIESSGDDDNATAWPAHAAPIRPADHLPLQRARTRTYANHHFLPGLDVHHPAHAHV